MKCDNCRGNGKAPGKEAEATLRLWCPTWVGCEKGPRNLCAECAKNFQPEHNRNAEGGSWHWGEQADAAFTSVVAFFPNTDPRYVNAKGMAENGTKVGDRTYVVDGEVWLIAAMTAVHLGKWPDVRDTFPKLFK
jgi:hypothetical protein